MIETYVDIHDKFSFECKISFISDKEITGKHEEFKINTWLFIPNGLDVNNTTYPKTDFFKDVNSNIRFITPDFSLTGIVEDNDASPKSKLENSLKKLLEKPDSEKRGKRLVQDLKMFAIITKSAIRDEVNRIIALGDKNPEKDCRQYVEDIERIIKFYRSLHHQIKSKNILDEWRDYYDYCENFISNIIEQHTFRLMSHFEKDEDSKEPKSLLISLLHKEEKERKKKKFPMLDADDSENNSRVVMQWSILKKVVESVLHLHIKSSRDGRFAEQLLYSLAAGVSMLFATIVTFTAQQHYEKYTLPLFLILVVSYMFKDRIKDLMRYYFNSQVGRKYFDHKRKLSTSGVEIGVFKEAADYVDEEKLPEEIASLRKRIPIAEAENRIYNEQIILYRKYLDLSVKKIASLKRYKYQGINDITKFHLFSLTEKMSDTSMQLYLPNKKNGYTCFSGEKVYPLHFIIRGESNQQVFFRKYRILFNRNGIRKLEEM